MAKARDVYGLYSKNSLDLNETQDALVPVDCFHVLNKLYY